MATAIGYIRVSTEGQAQDGVSLDAQRAKIAAWCELNDYTLAAVHVDAGISGKGMDNRPALQAALQDCRKGSALVVYSLSRLSRSVRDTMDISDRLNTLGADLVSLSERIDTTSAAGKMVFRMLAVLNEFERDQTSERTAMALQHKKAKGEKTGGAVPYGYTLAANGVDLHPDPVEQEVIRQARKLHAGGLSLRKIAAALNRRGFNARNGSMFQATQIQRMVA
jgi:DNA invertase Pin-like site-specific DNA recombinase